MPASRIDDIFRRQRTSGTTGLIPYITGGHPSLEATAAVLPALESALGPAGGIVEIGIPFSDPIADGPVIAAAMHEALAAGVTPPDIFETVRRLRGASELGLVAMVSASIVYRMGPDRFAADAADAGFDGLIVPDVVEDGETGGPADELAVVADRHGLGLILLVAPATPPPRLARIAERCRGFVYVLARAGITGERDAAPEAAGRVAAVRAVTDLPVAVGFGISRPEHVAAVTAVADAAVVGSGLVRRLTGSGDPAAAGAGYVRSLAAALARR